MGQIETCKKNMVYDAGVVFADYGLVTERILGMTRGGCEYELITGLKPIEADGLKGATMGMSRITKINCTLKVNILEQSPENLKLIMGCAAITDGAVYSTKLAEYLGLGTAAAETFAFDETPIVGTEVFFVDGVRQDWTLGVHYTITDDDVTIIGNATIAENAVVTCQYVYDTGGVATHSRVTPKWTVEDADYLENVALVVPHSSDPTSKDVVFFLKNCLSDGNLKANTTDENELVVPLTLQGHWEDIRGVSEDALTYIDYPVVAP